MYPKHFKVFLSFFLYAFCLSAIFPRLGDIQLQMNVSKSMLGLALIGAPTGVQLSLMFSNKVLKNLNFKQVMLAGIPILGFAEIMASTSTEPLAFFCWLLLAGLAIGLIEIVVNLEADRVEYEINKRIMNRSHAFWSLGFFVSATLGAIFSQLSLSPPLHLSFTFVVATLLTIVSLSGYEESIPRFKSGLHSPAFVKPSRAISLMVIFTLSAMLLEGAIFDWSVIFMRDVFQTSPFVNGLALVLGCLSQFTIRFFADGFIDRHGAEKVVRFSLLLLGLGAIFVSFAPSPNIALLGFAMIGVGNGVIFPVAISSAAQRNDRSASENIASLAQLSFITFLLAPPLLGLVADNFGIRVSFGLSIPLVALSWMNIGSIKSESKPII